VTYSRACEAIIGNARAAGVTPDVFAKAVADAGCRPAPAWTEWPSARELFDADAHGELFWLRLLPWQPKEATPK